MAHSRDLQSLQRIANELQWLFSSQDSLSGQPVKNTFIHFRTEEDLQPDMPKSTSNFLDGMPVNWHDDCALSNCMEKAFSKNDQAVYIQEGTLQVEDANQPSELDYGEKTDGLITQTNTSDNLEQVDHPIDQNGKVDELDQFNRTVRGAPWSAGSIAHQDGKCKPCAWNWKPSGCSKGLSCEFCHSCEENALQRKRRASRQQARRLYRI